MAHIERKIFKGASSTFYASSLLFPKKVRRDVFDLYSFLRTADDYVDAAVPNEKEFVHLRDMWAKAAHAKGTFDTKHDPGDTLNQRMIKNVVRLCEKYDFEKKWIDSFFDSLNIDLEQTKSFLKRHSEREHCGAERAPASQLKIGSDEHSGQNHGKTGKGPVIEPFENQKMLLFYMHGSAEVIGLMMARIMGLSERADESAKALGASLQMINFIRDIKEDNHLGRCYFVNSDLAKFGLNGVSEVEAKDHPEAFKAFVRQEIGRYYALQKKGGQGYKHIPRRMRVPVKTAADLYNWTAERIARNPMIVFEKKVKPGRLRTIKTLMYNFFTA